MFRPKLPPRKGYVEREDANGNRYYAPTAETLAAQNASAAQEENDELVLDLALDHETRLCLLELGLTEDDLELLDEDNLDE